MSPKSQKNCTNVQTAEFPTLDAIMWKSSLYRCVGIVFCVLWCYLLYNALFSPPPRSIEVDEPTIAARRQASSFSLRDIPFHPPTSPAATAEMPPLSEIEANLTTYLDTLHSRLNAIAGPKVQAANVWETFLDVTSSTIMRWEEQNKHRQPQQRNDGSIFVSLGTYRDPYCPMTIKSLYSMAAHPERLFVGLLQQNCFESQCRTGVLEGGKVEWAGSDINCYTEFCNSAEGKKSNACNTGQVRLFNVNESESLGPYMARYLGSKFYRGENYYLQIDSHSEFVENWDDKLIKMIHDAPAAKPVISTYPPDSAHRWRNSPGFRMCDSTFADAQIEWQIIRLSPSTAFESHALSIPTYAPFVAAGFYFTTGSVLSEVPFDPFLPWIFMGEEISMSARLWTSGYDIFSPTINVLNHYYVRRHYPKFWESVNRFFRSGVHNNIIELMIKRVKHMLGYPEARAELVAPSSLLYKLDNWGMGRERPLSTYLSMVGIDPVTKTVTPNKWCRSATWPQQALPYKKENK